MRVFNQNSSKSLYAMPGQNELTTETVRVDLPVHPAEKPPDPEVKTRKEARVQLPVGEAMDKMPVPIPVETATPAPAPPTLQTETASVSDLTDSAAAGAMKGIEPVNDIQGAALHDDPISAAPPEKNSMLLIWILLGVSALILIIQIWTYFS